MVQVLKATNEVKNNLKIIDKLFVLLTKWYYIIISKGNYIMVYNSRP